uniref:Uncharacterized protein LOC104220373 n=1 Tax=Nicotiana sylvestris TaxID=4096 RepID=A0A1U7VT49_NICSY|nr:PREDICTED: uncharacterized protein LOC104220373 [Nicotiana sylvestris]
MQQTIDDLTDKLNVVNAALQGLLRGDGNQIGDAANPTSATQKLKIREPKPYSGARNGKEVENFIFDVEQYFDAVGGLEEAIKAGEDALETWAELKAAIRLQFFPENVEYNSRRKLREIRAGLRAGILHAHAKHMRHGGQRQALHFPRRAETLCPYGATKTTGGQSSNGGPSRSGVDRGSTKPKAPSTGSNSAASNNNDRGRKPPSGCRHCGIPYWNNECPHAQMNAHQTFDDGTDDDSNDADQTEPVGAFNAIVGSISEALAETSAGIRKKKDPCPVTKKGKKKVDDETPLKHERTLMFVEMKVNGKPIRSMVDTCATHNYLASTQVERLGLVVGKALQLKKGVKRNEPTFLATLCIEDVERSLGPIPEPVKELLLEFEDVMPKRLPPRHTMDHEIELYIDEFVVVYLDDIVVYSKTLEEHLMHLRKVLSRLREHELYAKLSKCSFAQKQIDFLGHVIEEGWIKMDKQKIHAITDWPPPKDIHALRAFLGLCNFYRRFVKNYSLIAVPLTELLKKVTPWEW